MKFKLFLTLTLLLVFFNKVVSQNTLYIGVEEANTETAFDLPISLDNTDEIVAIQFDINFNDDAIELLTGHQLTSRASSHTLGVSTPSPGVIRVLIYSGTNASISGSTGDLVILKLKSKTLPGDFILNYSNVVVSSPTGSSITTTVQAGSIKVLGPQMNILSTEVDFGRVPIGTNPTNPITVQNLGNTSLELISVNSVLPFSIQESFPITIPANSSMNLTLNVDTSVKYNSSVVLSFQNNDPNPLRNIQSVLLKADVFAVNEITIGAGSGEISTEVEIPVVIDNMEPFTGLQFDITLPAGIDYVANSIIQSSRFNDHTISANIINGNILRFLAYSATNTDFNGTSGEVFSFKLTPNVASGTYPLIITNAILSNLTLGDILSDTYNGSIQINSPNLSLNPASISYGNVPTTEIRETTVRLTNTGSALLTIDDVIYAQEELSLDIVLPLDIAIGAFKDINLTFTPISIGEFSESISFRHNGPDEQNLLQVLATKFSPNFLMVESQQGYPNETNIFQVLLKNNDAVRAVQFDVELPTGFNLDVNNVAITERTVGFTVAASNLSGTTYRIILYSTSSLSLNPGDLSIISLPILISESVVLGVYSFNFTNVIISDINNQNISSIALENGEITIVDRIYINPTIFLQGPYDTGTGLMTDELRSSGLIPLTSPYTDALTVEQSVIDVTGTNAIIDWIWVELRDSVDETIVVASTSALLQVDGDVVDTDGISQLVIDIPVGNYYLMISHRNHLGVLTASTVSLAGGTMSLDLTVDSALVEGGINGIKDMGDGNFAIFAGDFNGDGQVQNTDKNAVEPLRGISGYENADIDMNGEVQNTDINNILNPNIGKGEQFSRRNLKLFAKRRTTKKD